MAGAGWGRIHARCAHEGCGCETWSCHCLGDGSTHCLRAQGWTKARSSTKRYCPTHSWGVDEPKVEHMNCEHLEAYLQRRRESMEGQGCEATTLESAPFLCSQGALEWLEGGAPAVRDLAPEVLEESLRATTVADQDVVRAGNRPHEGAGVASEVHCFDGVYHRMEDEDCTRRFKNGMRLTIEGTAATLEISRKKNKKKIDLVVEALSATDLRMDWTPAHADWGEANFRVCIVEGMKGLREGDTHFWKLWDSAGASVTTAASSGEQGRSRSRTPTGKAREWLEPPPGAPPLPKRLGAPLADALSSDASGVDGHTSPRGASTYVTGVQQPSPWPMTYGRRP